MNKNNKKKIDWGFYGYILAAVLSIAWIIGSMISYMSLNDWDVRCILTDCKPVSIKERK